MDIRRLQSDLKRLGHYTGLIDGRWGPLSEAAYRKVFPTEQLAWGAKVSSEFKAKVIEIAEYIGTDPNYLMACMAFESAETFSPSIRNAAGSGATGLIQFMPATARGLGTTTNNLAALTAEQQLDYVKKYFAPYRGRLRTLSDVYMAILWPAAIGKSESSALWSRAGRPVTYRQNAGLDANRDGVITKAEAAGKVQDKLQRGVTQFLG